MRQTEYGRFKLNKLEKAESGKDRDSQSKAKTDGVRQRHTEKVETD